MRVQLMTLLCLAACAEEEAPPEGPICGGSAAPAMTVFAYDGGEYVAAGAGAAPVACFLAPQGGVFSHLRIGFQGLDASAVTTNGSVSTIDDLEVRVVGLDGAELSLTRLRQFGRCEGESYLVPEVRVAMPVDDPLELDGVQAELIVTVKGGDWSFTDRLPVTIVASTFH